MDFLDALMELSEEKELVAEALEKGTLPLLKEQNCGEQPEYVGWDPEAQVLRTIYAAVSILLLLSEKPASVSC
uniref:Gasdermin B n=2 Tax=Rousettus aegyptiacus TaxID=9407 RepID=A0A7J8G8K4_ROUAE|nr:gasdermin B [Rousettus aegyptiacus]